MGLMKTTIGRNGAGSLSQPCARRVQLNITRGLWPGTLLALACLAGAPGLRLAQAQTSPANLVEVGPNHQVWSFGAKKAPVVQMETGMLVHMDQPNQRPTYYRSCCDRQSWPDSVLESGLLYGTMTCRGYRNT